MARFGFFPTATLTFELYQASRVYLWTVSELAFAASVSGAKNPVPGGKWLPVAADESPLRLTAMP
jgi:hypothetical protein